MGDVGFDNQPAIKVGGFDVNEVEEDSGLNPLAAALKCGNKVLLV